MDTPKTVTTKRAPAVLQMTLSTFVHKGGFWIMDIGHGGESKQIQLSGPQIVKVNVFQK